MSNTQKRSLEEDMLTLISKRRCSYIGRYLDMRAINRFDFKLHYFMLWHLPSGVRKIFLYSRDLRICTQILVHHLSTKTVLSPALRQKAQRRRHDNPVKGICRGCRRPATINNLICECYSHKQLHSEINKIITY